jgi:O-succinylbenzoic acid--CoA ligase
MDRDFQIIFKNRKSVLGLNPRLSVEEKKDLELIFASHPLEGHLYIASSGSAKKSGESLKLMALSYDAFLIAADSANQHIQATSKDIWLQTLPTFHVGGLGIYARAFLSGASVIDYSPWRNENGVLDFFKVCEDRKVTLTSLVPTQLFDLLKTNLACPKSLRAIIIGGGALSESIYQEACQKGWPILPSYGMTELCSQVATAELGSHLQLQQRLKILKHIQARINSDGVLEVQSQALMSGFGQVIDQKIHWQSYSKNSWYQTEDLVSIKNGYLEPKGRRSQFLKVLGEGVDLSSVQANFDELIQFHKPELKSFFQLAGQSDARQGQMIVIQILNSVSTQDRFLIESVVSQWNQRALPVERIQKIEFVASISWKRS